MSRADSFPPPGSDSLPVRSAEDHRRLAVAHRLAGTPRARFLSILEIDAALRIDPHNPRYHLEKGLTRYAQRFMGDAERSLKTAAALDPGCFSAWFHIGRIHLDAYFRTLCREQERRAAERSFRRANAIDGRHADTLFYLGLLALLEGRIPDTMEYAASGARLDPRNERFPLLAGACALHRGRFDEARRNFARASGLFSAAERAEFEDISALLTARDREIYLGLDEHGRLEYQRRFWVLNDPTPHSETNERLLEHFYRVFLARELLSLPLQGLSGTHTARGEALVRYGFPSSIACDLGSGTDGPFVIWRYEEGERRLTLYFQDEFLSGNYHIPIDPKYSGLAAVTEGVFRNLPQVYTFPVHYRDLPLAVQSAETRGARAATRLECSIAVPDTAFSGPRDSYRFALTIFDASFNRHQVKTIDVRPDTLAVLEKPGGRWRLLRIECELEPPALESTVVIEIWGGEPKSRAVHRETLVLRDYSGRFLELGSVRITLTDRDGFCGPVLDPLPVFGPGSIVCAACDIFNLRRDEFHRARYRITYSIRPCAGRAEPPPWPRGILSAIRAGVRTGPEFAPVISNAFERGTADRDVHERVALDVGTLERGAYLLVIEVEDLVAKRRASGERGFVVSD